jgi:hypothetical protein
MEGYNKLFKTKEITIVKEVRVYKGPELPFIKKVFCIWGIQRIKSMYLIWKMK